MKRYILFAASSLMMVSCLDTTVLPVDKIIEEDFWQSKTDVSAMVNGAYQAMTSADVIERMIVWGELRGDNVNPTTNLSTVKAGIDEINSLNMDDKNTYTSWTAFYDVINKCNLVLDHAEAVMSIDPSYSQGNYDTDRSQMLALRSLAYFYLVRTFRDVPYNATAFQNSSQFMEIGQASPDSVLTLCINDLEKAEPIALSSQGFKDWRRCGLVTRDGIRAILADIYLWRASMNKSAADYQKCVDLCNQIIESKMQIAEENKAGRGQISRMIDDSPLYKYQYAYQENFINGNSNESIFELQLNGSYAVNTAVRNLYYMYRENNTPGFISASKIMGSNTGSDNVFLSANDVRFWESTYGVKNNEADAFGIRKMVGKTQYNFNSSSPKAYSPETRTETFARFEQNWIVYRLTDIMLMKAEALTQLAADDATIDSDENLAEAFNMVQQVYNRSIAVESETLESGSYNNKEDMERLVLDERQRELCYEGKRWFDLIRYSYRHMTGVDSHSTMANQHQTLTNSKGEKESNVDDFPAVYSEMITLLSRKYLDNAGVLVYQLTTEPKLYMPISYSEIKVNDNLKQTPGYKSGSDYEKNF